MMAPLSTPANIPSATAPRKDSAQSSDEGLKTRTRGYAPHITSPLANCSSADIVTNDERAKSPELMRVLSPMRPRRTPKLVNAPEIRWRLPPALQRMPSFDSVLSSNTSASDVSNVRHVPASPHNMALPVSRASSVITTLHDTMPEDSPLPPSLSLSPSSSPSPPTSGLPVYGNTVLNPSEQRFKVDTRFHEARVAELPSATCQLRAHQQHFLSPVTEVSSISSIRSSIADVPIQEIGTAERRPLSDVRRQDVHIVGARETTPRVPVRDVGERDSQSTKEAEEGSGEQERRVGIREVFGRLRKSMKVMARKFVNSMVRKQVTKVLARVL